MNKSIVKFIYPDKMKNILSKRIANILSKYPNLYPLFSYTLILRMRSSRVSSVPSVFGSERLHLYSARLAWDLSHPSALFTKTHRFRWPDMPRLENQLVKLSIFCLKSMCFSFLPIRHGWVIIYKNMDIALCDI